MSNQAPTGTVTIMFTDIVGHTKTWERVGDDFVSTLESHNAILREVTARHNGYEVRTEGDAFMLAFAKASDAVLCAVEAQVALANHPWLDDVGTIMVRMGMHTGEVHVSGDDYLGLPVIRASRISDAGHGGQILVTVATRELTLGELPEGVEFIDLGLHRLKDLGRPERIYQVIHPDLPRRDFPPLKTLDIIPNNLPVQLTSFVGREAEIRSLAELLGREQVRLVTLIGTGGIGKTRLSIEIAAQELEHFPYGVWFVPLASLTDPGYVITEIASALSIQLQPKVDPKAQVIDYLSQKRLLLVLDNFEHLSEAASVVTDLLSGAPSLHCIVTSRELLHVSGEHIFSVSPLPSPPEDAEIEMLSQYESVRLFLERAQTVKPDFELTAQNSVAIAAICHRLDGIPLAIELAAVRVRGMTAQQIFERLERQPEFLSTNRNDVPYRHRTLRAAVDWSYELLEPNERIFFAQLSVFSGGFFMEAAEAICKVSDVFELLFSLQDKSLLVVDEVMERIRYRMLEPLHDYAQEKLGKSVELKQAHAEYYLGIAKDLDQKILSAEQGLSMSLMALELDNFRASMDFAQEQGAWKPLGELGVALSWFFYFHGLWSEGIQRLRQAEDALRRLQDNALLARALNQLGRFYGHSGQGGFETAQKLYTESLQIRRELGDKWGIAESLNGLGSALWCQGRFDEARQINIESLRMAKEVGFKRIMAYSLNDLGIFAFEQGAYDEAIRLCTESLKIKRELGEKRDIALSLNNLGYFLLYQGVYDEARHLCSESLQIARELGNKHAITSSLDTLALISLRQRCYDEARQLGSESLQIGWELGDRVQIALSLYRFGELAETEGDPAQALLFFTTAARIFEEMNAMGIAESSEVQEALLRIQKEIGDERFNKLKGEADAMSVNQVIGLVLD